MITLLYIDQTIFILIYGFCLNEMFIIVFLTWYNPGYGDSTVDDLNEQGIIEDSVQLYKWIQSNTALDIYLMGDKLGASIAAHVVSKVPSQNIPPVGVILINPWYSLTYEIKRWVWPFYQVFFLQTLWIYLLNQFLLDVLLDALV